MGNVVFLSFSEKQHGTWYDTEQEIFHRNIWRHKNGNENHCLL